MIWDYFKNLVFVIFFCIPAMIIYLLSISLCLFVHNYEDTSCDWHKRKCKRCGAQETLAWKHTS